ncbi:MAG TPA: hypothetical protein DCL08_07990 [Anaerolineaceae bacterium]|nr:hypothetical protein [Anaerolineaceae bacterium]
MNDGTVDSNVATISITINAVNDVPVAYNKNWPTDEDEPLDITLTANDIDGDVLTWHIVTQPAHGSLSGTAPDITYTPEADYNGSDSFTFKVNDGAVDSNVAMISITLNAVNDQPLAVNDSYGVFINETLTIDLPGVLANDSDVDGDSFIAVNFSDPLHGILTPNADGSFTYVPEADYTGEVSFTYQADDGNPENNLSDPATVTITVMDTSCLTVVPEFLEKSLNSDTTGTLTLTVTNLCDYDAPITLEEWEITLQEGFEGGVIPSGWETKYEVPSTWEWVITNNPDWVFEGQYAAWFNFDVNYADGWLLTPVIDTSTFMDLTLSFMAFSDTREDREATVEVWVTDEDGNGINKLWDMLNDENWDYPPEYLPVLVDLSDYAGYGEPIRIAWRYVGQIGQSFGLDSIAIKASRDVPWLSADPNEDVVLANDSLPITMRFDSTWLPFGDYFAGLNVISYLSPVIPVPVTLHVGAFGYEIFLPLVLR